MRIFLMLLIFAIGFSGYSAAAHAFVMESCGSEIIEKAQDCADHGDATSNQNSDQSSKDVCLDCHHFFLIQNSARERSTLREELLLKPHPQKWLPD